MDNQVTLMRLVLNNMTVVHSKQENALLRHTMMTYIQVTDEKSLSLRAKFPKRGVIEFLALGLPLSNCHDLT